ncbi:MAG: transketolase [Chitinophagaceae bacterium]|nr:MAG: transketolase [Chitinophagaceae bacterium]
MLEKIRDEVRDRLVRMYRSANAGHVGCSLSCLEMLVFIRFRLHSAGDDMILSKGHAAALLYSVLAQAGEISREEISSFYRDATMLPAHPPVGKVRSIPFATGSLGHGLSVAAGLGLAARLRKSSKQIFCLTSDGELNEGSIWEAAMFISHHNLTNVIWMIDRNFIQGFGRTEDVIRMEPLDQKLEAFGFTVAKADGHDFESMEAAVNGWDKQKPLAVICNTVKGRELLLQDTVDCHYLPLTEEDFNKLIIPA